MFRKWLPKSDILAHKNYGLFLSHVGMFGTFEVEFFKISFQNDPNEF